jgi:hypothetical protein
MRTLEGSGSLSRRTLLGAAAATPVLGTGEQPAPRTDTIACCAAVLALDAEIERLTRRWQKLETKFIKRHGFLPHETMQDASPEAAEMAAIDRSLEPLYLARETQFAALPATASGNMAGVVAKLTVVTQSIYPEDHPIAHAVLIGALRDLRSMST